MLRAGGTLRAAALRRAASRSCSSWRRWREDAPSEPPSERELYLRAELLECTARESPVPPECPVRGPATYSRDAWCSCAAREGEYFYAAQLPGALTNRGGVQHVIRTHAHPLPPRSTPELHARATRAAGAMPQSTQSSRPRPTSSARLQRLRAPPRTPLPLPCRRGAPLPPLGTRSAPDRTTRHGVHCCSFQSVIRNLPPGTSCARCPLHARQSRECCETGRHLMIVVQARSIRDRYEIGTRLQSDDRGAGEIGTRLQSDDRGAGEIDTRSM